MALLIATTTLGVVTATGACAEVVDSGKGLEEVVVTARKRAESVQEVPISVTAISGKTINEIGAGDFRELDGVIPNMVQVGVESNVSPTISIRGISSDSRNIGFESGVSVYVDGVYTGRPSSWMSELGDVESFEVLRGPQGTLFGKNTIAGAVNITTKKPGNAVEGSAEVEFGDYDLMRGKAALSGPLVDGKLFAGAIVYGTKRDGYQENVVNGKSYGNKNDYGGRAQLRYAPDESLDITLAADALHEHLRMQTNSLVAGAGFNPALSPRQIQINEPVFSERGVYGLSLNGAYTLANGGTITSITAQRWNNVEFLSDDDLSAGAFPRLASNFRDEEKQFTQEVRYASASEGRFRYQLGAYYYHQGVDTFRKVSAPPGGLGAPVELTSTINAKIKTEDFAAFGQADFDVTDKLQLTAGLRYTTEDKSLFFNLTALPPFGIIGIANRTYKQSSDAFSPMASALYKVTDDLNAYVTVSRGFKGGGFNADFVSNAQLAFGPEKVTNYEAGLKFFGFEHRLRANVAIFQMDYKDLQISQQAALGGFIIANAAKATIKGAEFDVEARPWEGFMASAGFGVNNAKFDFYPPTNTGNRLANAPKYTASVAAQQAWAIGDLGTITLRGEYNYRDDYFVDSNNAANTFIKGYGLGNVRLTYATMDDKYQVQLWVENVSDKLYIVDRGQPIGGLAGLASVVYGKPRMYGVRLSGRF